MFYHRSQIHLLLALLTTCATPTSAELVLNDLSSYSNDFEFLASSSNTFWTNDQATETATGSPGWYWQSLNPILGYGAGYATSPGAYSLNPSTANPDKALGSYTGSGLEQFAWGIVFRNNTGQAISQVEVSYLGEQWRRAGVDTGTDVDSLQFSFMTSTNNITDFQPAGGALLSGWTADSNLSFEAPLAPGVPLFDDPPAGSQVPRTGVLDVDLADGEFLALRWHDGDLAGADAALGIDDLSVSFTSVPEPSAFLFGGLVCGVLGLNALRKQRAGRAA